MGLIGLGIVLLIVGFLLGIAILWVIGIILVVVGAILAVARSGEAAWYRRWY